MESISSTSSTGDSNPNKSKFNNHDTLRYRIAKEIMPHLHVANSHERLNFIIGIIHIKHMKEA